MQARWFAKVFTGAAKLPSADKIRTISLDDKCHHKTTRPTFTERLHYTVDFSQYVTELAGYVGCRASMWRLFLFKPYTWLYAMFGPYHTGQFRIHGWGAKPGVFEQSISEYPCRLFVNDIITLGLLYVVMKPTCYLLSFFGFGVLKPVF
jgi:hypothetical protein